jgi:hypothetical protein
VPILAIYRTATMEQALEDSPPQNEQERAALHQGYARGRAMSNEADILRGCAFAATLPP